MQIKEFAAVTKVSVRTLHYYDEIGLLKPAFVDESNGYRFYDEKSLERMLEILFYRELDFPLKSILKILSSPNYSKQLALAEQKQLLILKKQRLERLISVLEDRQKGDFSTDMNIFDNSGYEYARKKYAEEAKEKWGNTAAYRESRAKTADYSGNKWEKINIGFDNILSEFASAIKDLKRPDEDSVQNLVGKLQEYITGNYYTCTDEILQSLGMLYTSDSRFKENIDKHGAGTAAFMSEAIRMYCTK